MEKVLASILSMAGLGLFFASVLAVVNQKLKIKEDPKIEAIENALPAKPERRRVIFSGAI